MGLTPTGTRPLRAPVLSHIWWEYGGFSIRGGTGLNAIERLHDCTAQFIEAVEVEETFQEQTVWEGIVHVFEITGNPKATRCYAWSSPIEGSTKRKFFAVLHIPPVVSAQDAVRAAIVQEYRKG